MPYQNLLLELTPLKIKKACSGRIRWVSLLSLTNKRKKSWLSRTVWNPIYNQPPRRLVSPGGGYRDCRHNFSTFCSSARR